MAKYQELVFGVIRSGVLSGGESGISIGYGQIISGSRPAGVQDAILGCITHTTVMTVVQYTSSQMPNHIISIIEGHQNVEMKTTLKFLALTSTPQGKEV